jgi:hypothetical protein
MRSTVQILLLSVIVYVLHSFPALIGAEESENIVVSYIPSTNARWVPANSAFGVEGTTDDDAGEYATEMNGGWYCEITYCGSAHSLTSSGSGSGSGCKCCGGSCCDESSNCCSMSGECITCPTQTDDDDHDDLITLDDKMSDDKMSDDKMSDDKMSDDKMSDDKMHNDDGSNNGGLPCPTQAPFQSGPTTDDAPTYPPILAGGGAPTMSPTMSLDEYVYLTLGVLLQGVKLSDLSSTQKTELENFIRDATAEVTHIDVQYFSLPDLIQLLPLSSPEAPANMRGLASSSDVIGAYYHVDAPMVDIIDGIMATNSSIVLDSESSLLELVAGMELALYEDNGATFNSILDTLISNSPDLSSVLDGDSVGVISKPTVGTSTTSPTSSPATHKSAMLAWPYIVLIVVSVVAIVVFTWCCCCHCSRDDNSPPMVIVPPPQHVSQHGTTSIVYGNDAARSNNVSINGSRV